MAIPNPNWPRWIAASIADTVKTKCDAVSLPLLVEGVDERESEIMRAADHVELRIYGPAIQEVSKDYFRLYVEINLLFTEIMGGETKNAYDIIQFAGELQQHLSSPINLYKYGTGAADDQSYFGCLQPTSGKNDSLALHNFGQISRDDRIRQAMVDGRYQTFLCA